MDLSSLREAQDRALAERLARYEVPCARAPLELVRLWAPRDWVSEPPPVEAGDGLRFVDPGSDARLDLMVTDVLRELTAERYLRLMFAGQPILGMDVSIESPLRAFAEVRLPKIASGISPILYILASLHGPVAVLAVGRISAMAPEEAKIVLRAAVASLEVEATGQPTAERRLSGLVAGTLNFSYPASWTLASPPPPFPGKAAADLVLMEGDTLLALLRIKLVLRAALTSIGEEAARTRQDFIEAGFEIGPLIEATPIVQGARFQDGLSRWSLARTAEGAPIEFWLLEAVDAKYLVHIVMIAPDRRDDFLTWALARTALDIVAASLS